MSFPHTERTENVHWTNFHGTVSRDVAEELRPTLAAGQPSTDYGSALRAILQDSFSRGIPLRTIGARWSLSEVGAPGARTLEPSDLNRVSLLANGFAKGSFAAHLTATGSRAALIEGGTHVFRVNQELGRLGYALRTSGASDGHRMAGMIATGTHGSALHVGAVHDTVKALHVVIAPDKAVLLQPAHNDPAAAASDAPFAGELAQVLTERSGIPTELVADDDLFFAAVVSLGSFGVVHSVIVDVAPLYVFSGDVVSYAADDARLRALVQTLDPTVVGQTADPYHLALVVVPYASDDKAVYVTSLGASPLGAKPYLSARPQASVLTSNVADIIAKLVGKLDNFATAPLVEKFLNDQAKDTYKTLQVKGAFASQVFGPTRLPPGVGTSSELCFAHADAWPALEVIRATIRREANHGRHLLSGINVRFVPATRALLGMNMHAMNCFIEMPTIHASYTEQLYRNIWAALDAAGLKYAFHWGQVQALTPARVVSYYGERVERWKAARAAFLTPAARTIFASPILTAAGLA